LYLDAPSNVNAGEPFTITVETGKYDANWNLVRVPVPDATVVVGTKSYTTEADGKTEEISLETAGNYNVKAEKLGYIGTYYMTPGGYHVIHCHTAAWTPVTIHVLGDGNKLFSGEVDVSNTGFEKDGFWID